MNNRIRTSKTETIINYKNKTKTNTRVITPNMTLIFSRLNFPAKHISYTNKERSRRKYFKNNTQIFKFKFSSNIYLNYASIAQASHMDSSWNEAYLGSCRENPLRKNKQKSNLFLCKSLFLLLNLQIPSDYLPKKYQPPSPKYKLQ